MNRAVEGPLQVEQRHRGGVGKHLDDLPGWLLAPDVGMVGKTEELQSLTDGFGPQSTVAGQIAPVRQVGSGFEAAKNGRHLPIAGAAAGFVGHGQGGVDGYQRRCAVWDGLGDEIDDGFVIPKGGACGQHLAALRKNHPSRAVAWRPGQIDADKTHGLGGRILA